jgi:hypothetical protein
MTAEFIQSCAYGSPLLEYFAERDGLWQKGGREIKKAIADNEFVAWFPFNMKNLNSHWFTVQRMKYEGELYAIVTNSGIDYIFKIY